MVERIVPQEYHVTRSVSEVGGGKVIVIEMIDHPTDEDLQRFPFQAGDFIMRRQDIGGTDSFIRSVARERSQVPQKLLAEIEPE